MRWLCRAPRFRWHQYACRPTALRRSFRRIHPSCDTAHVGYPGSPRPHRLATCRSSVFYWMRCSRKGHHRTRGRRSDRFRPPTCYNKGLPRHGLNLLTPAMVRHGRGVRSWRCVRRRWKQPTSTSRAIRPRHFLCSEESPQTVGINTCLKAFLVTLTPPLKVKSGCGGVDSSVP